MKKENCKTPCLCDTCLSARDKEIARVRKAINLNSGVHRKENIAFEMAKEAEILSAKMNGKIREAVEKLNKELKRCADNDSFWEAGYGWIIEKLKKILKD